MQRHAGKKVESPQGGNLSNSCVEILGIEDSSAALAG
jgi:hypothetical protein